jgi:hypothetical protein
MYPMVYNTKNNICMHYTYTIGVLYVCVCMDTNMYICILGVYYYYYYYYDCSPFILT